jgi:hypothetical protein
MADPLRAKSDGPLYPQKQTSFGTVAMSALCQKQTLRLSRSDHLVGAEDERLRKSDTERLSSLEIKNQLEFGRLLNRKVGGLRAFQYSVGIGRCTADKIGEVLPI